MASNGVSLPLPLTALPFLLPKRATAFVFACSDGHSWSPLLSEPPFQRRVGSRLARQLILPPPRIRVPLAGNVVGHVGRTF